jgi:hypothetical protein
MITPTSTQSKQYQALGIDEIANDIETVFTAVNDLTPTYKVYTAVLTQSGTNAPTANVLENTLGGTVILARVGVGEYTATLNGAFASGFFIDSANLDYSLTDNESRLSIGYTDANSIVMFVQRYDTGSVTDGWVGYVSIRVYA